MLVELLIFACLLFSSAFFSGSEVALLSIDLRKRDELMAADDKASRRVLHLLNAPGHTLITILTLNTVINVAIALLGTVITGRLAHDAGWSPLLVGFLEVVVLTFILLIVGEITPKMLAQGNSVTFSKVASAPITLFAKILSPVTGLLHGITNRIYSRLEVESNSISTEDLKYLADLGIKHGTIEQKEHEMIHLIAEFSETAVREIMVSRLDIVAFSTETTVPEALKLIQETGFSRFPLYREYLDNIVGLVYAKDLLALVAGTDTPETVDWLTLCRAQPMYVPENKHISDLLEDFRRNRMHMAIVIDEHGGTEGLVTLENILEEIVGDITDEHDVIEVAHLIRVDRTTYRANGRLALDDVFSEFKLIPDPAIDLDNIDTLAGLILYINEDIPTVGDTFRYQHLLLTVEKVENHRIEQVLIRVSSRSPV